MQTPEPPYEVALEKSHSRVLINPALTDAEWAEIERAGDDIVQQINGQATKGLIVDLTPLNYMGSSMVAMIVRCWKAVSPKKQKFVVVCNSDVVNEVLQLSGLAKMWTIVPTREEALRSLGISAAVAAGESPRSQWLMILGIVFLIASLVGIALWFVVPDQRQLATGLIYGGGGAGFAMGLIVMLIAHGNRRFIGLSMVLVGVAAVAMRIMQ